MYPTRISISVISIWLSALCAISSAQTWTEDSFEDFADGHLDASGQNIYVHRDGTVRTIHRFDLNDDGHIDLLFNSTHDHYTMIPARLASVTKDRRVDEGELAVEGSERVAMADLNRDGYQDVVFMPNRSGVQHRRRFITIVWGGADGWPAHRANGVLPMRGSQALAICDLNRDAWPDIAVLGDEAWMAGQPSGNIVRVFWGGERGFLLTRRHEFGVEGALDLASADLDDDGAADLAVLTDAKAVEVVWSTSLSPTGAEEFPRARHDLSGEGGRCVTAADADGDGHVDLVVGTDHEDAVLVIPGRAGREFGRARTLDLFNASHVTVGDLDTDGQPDMILTDFDIAHAGGGEAGPAHKVETTVHILWGDKTGFDRSRVTPMQFPSASATAIGDLDGDGNQDLAIAVYQGEETYAGQSVLLFGRGNRQWTDKRLVGTEGAIDVAVAPASKHHGARVVFCNLQGGSLMEAVPLLLYWGGPQGFDPKRLWKVPVDSGYEASGADLNADGFVDLIAINSGHLGEAAALNPYLGANIFWGGPPGTSNDSGPAVPHGFDPDRRTALREWDLGVSNAADLDRDGYLDVVLGAFDGHEDEPGVLVIHFGAAGGFDPARRVAIPSPRRSLGCAIADYNHDRWLDIAVSGYHTSEVRVFWGGPDGFDAQRKLVLDAPSAIGLETADLNADGHLDLIVGSYSDPEEGHHDTGTLIFWGSDDGFKSSNAQWLPGFTPIGYAVADFDGDGFLDLFSPHYHAELTRESLPCFLYWGSASGFRTRDRTTLICNSAHDSLAADFDRDGRLDLAVSCHTSDGSHHTLSRVFYNDGKRFANPRTEYLPTHGTHWMYVQDMGHIYHRRWEQTYESSVFEWDTSARQGTLTSKADRPEGTELLFEVHAASRPEGLEAARWQAVAGGRFTLESTDRALQYRARFKSDNGDRFPVLDRVNIRLGP